MKSETSLQELAISEYLSCNKSLVHVAKKYGFTGGWLLKHLKSRGIHRRGNSQWKLNKQNELLACQDYKDGIFVKDIASKYGVSRKTITEWLKRNSITPLTNSGRLGITNDMKEYARKLYSDDKMNCVEISQVINVSHRSILDWVSDIKRTKSEISCISSYKGKKKNYGIKGNIETRFGVIRHDSLFEKNRILQLCANENVEMVSRCNYFIKYGNKNYNPDFLVKYKCGCVCIEEVKPLYMVDDAINVSKFEAANLFCKQHNILFKVVTEKEIYGK